MDHRRDPDPGMTPAQTRLKSELIIDASQTLLVFGARP
jgi:hypothetical protein